MATGSDLGAARHDDNALAVDGLQRLDGLYVAHDRKGAELLDEQAGSSGFGPG
jgi:hypothetical protein